MRSWLLAVLLCLAGTAMAEERAKLLIYISPHEYEHPVQLGIMPYFNTWIERGPLVQEASREALAPHFASVGVCDGSNAGDVIAWVKPQLTYNPSSRFYYAKVKVQFHLGDGRHLGTLKAEGQRNGFIDSAFINSDVRKAYDAAMQDIARQYAADAALQQAVHDGLAKDFTRAPCSIVGIYSTH